MSTFRAILFGITSENAYGTLDIAEIPAPEYNISTTPKLLIITANASANSPLNICKFSLSVVYPSIVFAFDLHIGIYYTTKLFLIQQKNFYNTTLRKFLNIYIFNFHILYCIFVKSVYFCVNL